MLKFVQIKQWSFWLQAASALGVRGPRQSVGVQIEGGAYCVMLPYSVCAPCSARQIFTTTQDNQSQVRRFCCQFCPTLDLDVADCNSSMLCLRFAVVLSQV